MANILKNKKVLIISLLVLILGLIVVVTISSTRANKEQIEIKQVFLGEINNMNFRNYVDLDSNITVFDGKLLVDIIIKSKDKEHDINELYAVGDSFIPVTYVKNKKELSKVIAFDYNKFEKQEDGSFVSHNVLELEGQKITGTKLKTVDKLPLVGISKIQASYYALIAPSIDDSQNGTGETVVSVDNNSQPQPEPVQEVQEDVQTEVEEDQQTERVEESVN